MLTLSCFLFLCAFCQLTLSGKHFPLDGEDWKVENEQGSYKDIPAVVPGSIFTDLICHGTLDDPYFGDNDNLDQWVSRDNWIYTKQFTVDEAYLASSNIDLMCGGLDTIAEIRINDVLVGKSEDMFRRYVFPVKPMLKSGTNTIRVSFYSAVDYASEKRVVYPYEVPPDCPSDAQRGVCHVNFIRKEQCSFSWDWGPSFPTMGIWRNITLSAYDSVTIHYITAQTTKDAQSNWQVSGSVFLDIDSDFDDVVTVSVDIPGVAKTTVQQKPDGQKIDFLLKIPSNASVKPWMPNGFGTQTLYDLQVSMATKSDTDMKRIRIGFRTVEVVQEKINGSTGLSFYFRVNDVPVFMKGSNWIPADSFQERITTEYLYRLLASAQEANMNMLRVWGGGIYESEEFYELADELGIMIWQDFMFACALYPTDKEFLDNVREEVTHQVRRLMHHPSIAIWAGNNENEGDIHKSDKQHYEDYVTLYIGTIRSVVLLEDTSRPFVSSSPSNGLETERQGWVADNPQSEYYGDVHHYDYGSDNWDWTVYPRPRFASEFGFQSWCSMEAVEAVSTENDWAWDSEFANHRNHHPNGNPQIVQEWSRHFDNPPASNKTNKQQFEEFIYVSQINQAMGIRTEAELYRRLQGRLMDGRGHTMGSLYWQLNDIWQAPTWASIEYGGKWKMLHYYARKFYNQTLLSPAIEGDNVVVYYVDDHNTIPQTMPTEGKQQPNIPDKHENEVLTDSVLRFQPVNSKKMVNAHEKGAPTLTLYLQMYSYANVTGPVKTWSKTFPTPLDPSTVIFNDTLASLLSQSGCSKDTCFLFVTLNPASDDAASNVLFFSYFHNVLAKGLTAANVKIIAVTKTGDRAYLIDLESTAVAPFVWLEARGVQGRFSDNGFLMKRNRGSVMFNTWDEENVEDVRASMTVRSLMDMY